MIAGPALVDWASLGEVDKEELGASKIHTRNGAIDDEVSTEAEPVRPSAEEIEHVLTGDSA